MQRIPTTTERGDTTRAEADGHTVLVTGGSGYLGGWMIVALLQRGYRVRTTLRSLGREAEVRAAVTREVDPQDRLSFFAADLLGDQGWQEAVEGCHAVLHVASPMGQGMPKGTDLVTPAREGTLRLLKAAAHAGVRRVVITSSTVAAQPPTAAGQSTPEKVDESVWTDPSETSLSDYARSKTLAERAAWEFVERSRGGPTLSTVLPGMILGPIMAKSVAGSVELVSRMLTGRFPLIPRIGFGTVDVRDLTDLHLRAMEAPAAAGQRFIAVSDFLWMSDTARILREHFGVRARKVPTRALPGFVLRLAALFSTDAQFMTPLLGVRHEYSTAKAETLLGWRPRPASQAVLDCAESIISQGLA